MFSTTDFQAMRKDLDLCFCEFVSFEKVVDEALLYAYKRYRSKSWPEMLHPSNTTRKDDKSRFIPIVCAYHILILLLEQAHQLKETLEGSKLFPRKITNTDSVQQNRKREHTTNITDLLGSINILFLLLAIDDWMRLLITKNEYNKAIEIIGEAYETHPENIAIPKNKQIRRALFIVNTTQSLRLFAEACWKALVPPDSVRNIVKITTNKHLSNHK